VQAGGLRQQEAMTPANTVITTERRLPTNRAELRAQMAAAHTALWETIYYVTPEGQQLPGPDGWSAQDHLAHLVPWVQGMVALLRGESRWAAMGLDATTLQTLGIDGINACLQERSQDWEMGQILMALDDAHNQLLALLAPMTDADLYRPYNDFAGNEPIPDGDQQAILYRLVGNTVEHYQEHLVAIRALTGGDS
jgi:hypothetical protein